MPINLDHLDLTRDERRALLSRLLDIVDGEHAVRQIFVHAQCLIASIEREQAKPDRQEFLSSWLDSATTSARAALPGLRAMADAARSRLASLREPATIDFRRRMQEKYPHWPSPESEIEAARKQLLNIQADIAECMAIIARTAPDHDLVATAADLER